MERKAVAPRLLLADRRQFYAIWIPMAVLAILIWAWRWNARDTVPEWAILVSYGLLIFAVMLPLRRAFSTR